MAHKQIKHGIRRVSAAVLIGIAVLSGVAFAPAASADVGGCYSNCAGDYRRTDPAIFNGVTTRSDKGVIGININRGFAGNVKVEAWVYVYTNAGWVFLGKQSQWFADNYSSANFSAPGYGDLTIRPGTRGYHAVKVRVSYPNGYVVFDDWSTSYRNFRWVQNMGWQAPFGWWAVL